MICTELRRGASDDTYPIAIGIGAYVIGTFTMILQILSKGSWVVAFAYIELTLGFVLVLSRWRILHARWLSIRTEVDRNDSTTQGWRGDSEGS
jgi:hypothetical protein